MIGSLSWFRSPDFTRWQVVPAILLSLLVALATNAEAQGQNTAKDAPQGKAAQGKAAQGKSAQGKDTQGNTAQGNPAQGGANATMEIAKADGQLAAMAGQTIKLTRSDKSEVFLVLGPDTDMKYSAEADMKWLSPGLMVRFTASFDQGRATAALKQLEVFVPSTRGRLTGEQMRDQTPGVYQEGKGPPEGAKGLFADDKKKAAKAAAPAGNAQTWRVVGALQGLQKNTMLVAAGTQPIQIELDPAISISVIADDLTFANSGDNVTVSGLRNPAQPTIIQAEKIELKAAKKLTQAQPAGRTSKSRGRNSKDADPAGKTGKDAKDGDKAGTKQPAGKSTGKAAKSQ